MEKEILIKKWLDNNLTVKELEEFKQIEEYDSFMKLSNKAQFFKAPNFNSSEEYQKITPIIDAKRTTKTLLNKLKPILQIAAVLIIGIVVYTSFFINNFKTINTIAGEKTIVTLPDNSIAQLNSVSELRYNEETWESTRTVELNGEAYFKVAKGSQFDVQTPFGIVSVLGTQFNVKSRQNYFEVICYEGKVRVSDSKNIVLLTAGKTVRFSNGNPLNNNTKSAYPSWTDNYSTFKSIPFSEVITEFERQYNVKIKAETNVKILFTGTFTHTDEKLALQSITIPLNLKYEIKENLIRLYE